VNTPMTVYVESSERDEPVTPVMISVEAHDASIIEALIADPIVKGDQVVRDGMSGGSGLLNVMITLTPVVSAAVVKILHDKWQRDSKIKIQGRGITLQGVTPKEAEALFKQFLKVPDAHKD
jgi:hypothetical protein